MRSVRERLEDMLEQIALLERHAVGRKEQFDSDVVLQTFCWKRVEVIGEAAFKLPPDLLARYPGVSWDSIIGMRHILVHDYFSVRWDVLWRVVDEHLAPLRAEVETMLRDLPAEENDGEAAHG